MVIELIILLFIIWIWSSIGNNVSINNNYNISKINNKIKEVTIILNKIANHLNLKYDFKIVESLNYSFTENKKIIHLVVWNYNKNTLFNDQVILSVAIHELTHIICPDKNHTYLFYMIEDKLIKAAKDLNFDPENDEDYPIYK